MARQRIISPKFFLNDELAALPPHARLLFVGLWCLADREGRLEDRPTIIRAQVFPYETEDVDSLLALLETHGFITRYEIPSYNDTDNGGSTSDNGGSFIQIRRFLKYQHPHHNETKSVIPAPTCLTSSTIVGSSPSVPVYGTGKKKEGEPSHSSNTENSTPPDPEPRDHSPIPAGPLGQLNEAAGRLWPRLKVSGIPRHVLADIKPWLNRGDTPENLIACFEEAARQDKSIGWAVRFLIAQGWSPKRSYTPATKRPPPACPCCLDILVNDGCNRCETGHHEKCAKGKPPPAPPDAVAQIMTALTEKKKAGPPDPITGRCPCGQPTRGLVLDLGSDMDKAKRTVPRNRIKQAMRNQQRFLQTPPPATCERCRQGERADA